MEKGKKDKKNVFLPPARSNGRYQQICTNNSRTLRHSFELKVKPGSHMICNDQRPLKIIWEHSTLRLRRTIRVIGRVELGSTFPTITISPTTTDFNGNACLGWSAAIGDIPLFLLKHVSVTAQLELRKKFAPIFAPNTSSKYGRQLKRD